MEFFPDLKTARLALLGESCAIANTVGLQYAVCGGWSPFLRNAKPIPHPGTKDVDLLFADGVKIEGLKMVFDAFRKHDYLPSAKHEFQLIKVWTVGGCRLAFNVDLLHPTEGKVHGDMFVEHVELPVLEDANAIAKLTGKSIAAPYSKFVFSGFVEEENVAYRKIDGTEAQAKVPLIDEVGVLVTKSESCRGVKRPRDLFDIYVAITQPQDANVFQNRMTRLQTYHPAAFALLAEIFRSYDMKGEPSRAHSDVFKEARVSFSDATASIDRFLRHWGLVPPAREGTHA